MKASSVLWILPLLLAGCGRMSHPSDDTLIQRFKAQRSQFEELVQMTQQDPLLKRVSVEFTSPDDAGSVGVTPERLQLYHALLRKVRTPLGIVNVHQGTYVTFIASGKGLGISGSGKGYLYTTVPPEPLQDKLDTYASADNVSIAYRHIIDNWYLWAD